MNLIVWKDETGENVLDTYGQLQYISVPLNEQGQYDIPLQIPLKYINGQYVVKQNQEIQYVDNVNKLIVLKDENGENILDAYGQLQYIEKVPPSPPVEIMTNEFIDNVTMTSTRVIKYEYEYNIRYLNEYAEIITKEVYDISGGHIAAYVGCTYHCG